MIELILFTYLQASAETATAQWTDAKTEKATITAYDAKCVEIKTQKGKKLSLNREGFKDMKLMAGTTQVEIHPDTVAQDLCSAKAP